MRLSPEFFSDRPAPIGFVMPIPGRDPGNQFFQAILAVGGPHDNRAILAHTQVQRVAFPQAGGFNDSPGKPHCRLFPHFAS